LLGIRGEDYYGILKMNTIIFISIFSAVRSADVLFPAECRNCTLLLEKDATDLGPGTFERSCAEVDIRRPAGQLVSWLSPNMQKYRKYFLINNLKNDGRMFPSPSFPQSATEQCSGNGHWEEDHCRCQHGFSGQYCQQKGSKDPKTVREGSIISCYLSRRLPS
jgi:hypothetical protein